MKFLILGASGMAGHTIALYLQKQGHDITGFGREDISFCKTIVGDVRNTQDVKEIISEGNYDSIMNCIGILNQFAEQNKGNATFLNAYLPHFLAEVTSDTNTQVIHLSTDCVFSGKHGRYAEFDLRDGETFYDRSKALGELDDDKNITIRTSIVGPDMKPKGIGLLNWFMQQDNTVVGYTKAMWTGVTTIQLAKIMEVAAKDKVHGLFNMVYEEPISKYELLKIFNKYLKNNSLIIEPCDKIVTDKSLRRTRFELEYSIPDYEVMVMEMMEWMKQYKNMYPHYDIH